MLTSVLESSIYILWSRTYVLVTQMKFTPKRKSKQCVKMTITIPLEQYMWVKQKAEAHQSGLSGVMSESVAVAMKVDAEGVI